MNSSKIDINAPAGAATQRAFEALAERARLLKAWEVASVHYVRASERLREAGRWVLMTVCLMLIVIGCSGPRWLLIAHGVLVAAALAGIIWRARSFVRALNAEEAAQAVYETRRGDQ